VPLEPLWDTVADPHHLPRWWPRVIRVEDVTRDAFTEVLSSSRGRLLRADFALRDLHRQTHTVHWEQLVENTPFARLLKSAHTTVSLAPASDAGPRPGSGTATAAQATEVTEAAVATEATEVTIELTQTLNGFFSRFGSVMVRKAAIQTLDEALDGLERIAG
jgi:hypothetical protein